MTFEVTLLAEHLHPWVVCVAGGWDVAGSLSVQLFGGMQETGFR